MKKGKVVLVILAAAGYLFISAGLYAQESPETEKECGCGAETKVIRDDDLGRWAEESSLSYEGEDGNLYWWLSGDSEEAILYEESGDEEGLLSYISRVAGRYDFGSEKDKQGFVEWVFIKRPWTGEQEK